MRTIHAAAAVALRGDEVLALRVKAGASSDPEDGIAGVAARAGTEDGNATRELWGFPNAVLERDEAPTDACLRAVMDTTGLAASNPRAFYTVEYVTDEQVLSMECFFCDVGGARVQPDPHVAAGGSQATETPTPSFRWIPRGELARLCWIPADVELVEALGAESQNDDALVKRRADSRKSMQGNKRANTKPELLVRQRLREAGLPGYRLQWKKAPGRPDIAYPGRKVAIFVNGCYWHRCPLCQPPIPKRNAAFWEAKFARNVERDARALAELDELGWTAITVWECQLKRDTIDATMERVVEQVRAAQPIRPG